MRPSSSSAFPGRFPQHALAEFAEVGRKLFVIEEGSDYLTMHVKALGVERERLPLRASLRDGEISPRAHPQAFGKTHLRTRRPMTSPASAALCAGCPHRLVFKELARIKAIVTGDIGCYTLGALPPLSAMDTCVDMGASVSMSHGFELALANREHKPVVAVIGDSTFGHSGLSSLITTVYNRGAGTICILDNRTTAMTGRQGNPFNGVTLQNRESRELDLGVVGARHRKRVQVNPHDAKAVRDALKTATKDQADELSVIVFKAPCVLLHRERKPYFYVNGDCRGCGQCTSLGCPAISKDVDNGLASSIPPNASDAANARNTALRCYRADTGIAREGGDADEQCQDGPAVRRRRPRDDTRSGPACARRHASGLRGEGERDPRYGSAGRCRDDGRALRRIGEHHGSRHRAQLDCMVSFETTEALRNLSFLKEGGYLLVSDETIKPLPVACGQGSHARHDARRGSTSAEPCSFPHDLAVQAGNAKCENVVILGALESLGLRTRRLERGHRKGAYPRRPSTRT